MNTQEEKDRTIRQIVDIIIEETFIRGIDLDCYRKNFIDAATAIYNDIIVKEN